MPAPGHPGSVCETEAGAHGAAAGYPGPGFHWMVLQRHGRRPLAVLGRALLRADNRCAGLPCWSEIAIQETIGARFVACVRHTPPPAAGPPWRDAWLCEDAAAARAAFEAHDPLWALPWMPPWIPHPWPPSPLSPLGVAGRSRRDGASLDDISLDDTGSDHARPEDTGPGDVGPDGLAARVAAGDAARQFRAAWAGLLMAVFGLSGGARQAPPAAASRPPRRA